MAKWTTAASLLAATLMAGVWTPAVRAQPPPQLQVKAVGKDLAYAYVILPADYRLSVKFPSGNGRVAQISKILRCDGVAMTGGFSRRSDPKKPEGLLIVDGGQVSRFKRRPDGGIVVLEDGAARIFRLRDRARWPDGSRNVIQSHPILFMNGKLDPLGAPEKANRVALGRLKDGRHFMIMAYDKDRSGLSALSLKEFAEGASTMLDHKIDWMMNFDGGPSVFLATREKAISPSTGEITSYLCAEQQR